MKKRGMTLEELLETKFCNVYFNKVDTFFILLEMIIFKKNQKYIAICNSEKFDRLYMAMYLNMLNKNDLDYIKELTYKSIYCIIEDIDEVVERYIGGGKKMTHDFGILKRE